MFAIAAVICFSIALILKLVHSSGTVWLDFTLAGAICVAAALAWGWSPWARQPR